MQPPLRSPRSRPAIASRLIVGLVTAAACAAPAPLPRAEIDGRTFAVEVAETEAARSRGLIGRAALPPGTGMAFVFERDTDGGFHMRGTLLALDIAFVTADGRVARVLSMSPCPAEPCPAYAPGVPYRWALEVNAGALAGVREGAPARLVR